MGNVPTMSPHVLSASIPALSLRGRTDGGESSQMGYRYKIGKFPLKANGRALIMNNGEGVVKFVVEEESDKILGVHILGSRATDLIGEAAMAIGMGAGIEDLAMIYIAHPPHPARRVRDGSALSSIHLAIHIPNK